MIGPFDVSESEKDRLRDRVTESSARSLGVEFRKLRPSRDSDDVFDALNEVLLIICFNFSASFNSKKDEFSATQLWKDNVSSSSSVVESSLYLLIFAFVILTDSCAFLLFDLMCVLFLSMSFDLKFVRDIIFVQLW